MVAVLTEDKPMTEQLTVEDNCPHCGEKLKPVVKEHPVWFDGNGEMFQRSFPEPCRKAIITLTDGELDIDWVDK